MKIILTVLSLTLLLISCSTADSNHNTYTADTFPREWINVEQKENDWIIFEPCDAATPELQISKENGKNIFTVLSGHVADPYSIEQFQQNSDGSVTISVRYESDPETLKFTFSKTGADNVWTVKAPDNIESNYIEKQNSSKFKKVVQPCRECWEEADCAEMEKSK